MKKSEQWMLSKNVERKLEAALEDVELDEMMIKRVEGNVLATITAKSHKPKKVGKYIAGIVAACLCIGIVTYQLPGVKAWVKETFTYIPSINKEINKSGGVTYELKKPYKKGEFTIQQVAYEATLPVFSLEFTYNTGLKEVREEEADKINEQLKNQQAFIIIGEEKYPIITNFYGGSADGKWHGIFELKNKSEKLPTLVEQKVTLQFGDEVVDIPLTRNDDTYTRMVNEGTDTGLHVMMLEKKEDIYINFIYDDVPKNSWSIPYINEENQKAWVEDEYGKKAYLKSNETGIASFGKYKATTTVKGKERKVVVPYHQITMAYENEKITIPIPKKVYDEITLPAIKIPNTSVVIEDVKVIKTNFSTIELRVSAKQQAKKQWLQGIDFNMKDVNHMSSKTSDIKDEKGGITREFAHEFKLDSRDQEEVEVYLSGADVVSYGPWVFQIETKKD